jgi:hypothetical protein
MFSFTKSSKNSYEIPEFPVSVVVGAKISIYYEELDGGVLSAKGKFYSISLKLTLLFSPSKPRLTKKKIYAA